MASRHVTSFYMLEMLLKLTKDNSNFAKINETIPVKKNTIAWSVSTKFNMKFKRKTQKLSKISKQASRKQLEVSSTKPELLWL